MGPAGTPTVDDVEKLEAIRDVMDYAARVTIQTALAKPMQSVRARPIAAGLLALLALSLVAYVFLSEPDWVFGPPPAIAIPAREEAHIRYAMFLAAQRLEATRDSVTGEPAATLADVGEDWTGLEYRRLGLGVFELRGRTAAGDVITYKSGEDPVALLKDARAHLRERDR